MINSKFSDDILAVRDYFAAVAKGVFMPSVGDYVRWKTGPFKGLLTRVVDVDSSASIFTVVDWWGNRHSVSRAFYVDCTTEIVPK